MGSTGPRVEYPATSGEMTAALKAALGAGDLERIMGIMGEMARAHRMRRVARETGLGEKSLYKSMRAGASPEFNTVLRVLRSLGFQLQVHLGASSDERANWGIRQSGQPLGEICTLLLLHPGRGDGGDHCLTSSQDPFMFLLQGSGRGGTQEARNDDIVSGNTNSQIEATLPAGSYTVEATTYNPEVTGDFTLSVSLTQE